MRVELSVGELELIIEALMARASRHQSYAKAKPLSAGPHDRKAEEMSKLAGRLLMKADAY